MKKELKGFIAGFIMCMILSSAAFAAPIERSITAIYNDIKIYVDGNRIQPKDAKGNKIEPFGYNGTTYLPVRAISEALGKTVSWDGKTNSVYIGQKPVQKSNKVGYTKDDIKTENFDGKEYVMVFTLQKKYNCLVTGTEHKLSIYDDNIIPAWDVDYMKPLIETESFIAKNDTWYFEANYYESKIEPILSQPREKKSTYSKDGLNIYLNNNVEYVLPSDIIMVYFGDKYRFEYVSQNKFSITRADNTELISGIPSKVVNGHLSIEYTYFKNNILPQIKK
jgi:uncharacterized protein YneR